MARIPHRIPLPPLGPGFRLRLDPSHRTGQVAVAWLRVETSSEPLREPWASPRELRGKKFIASRQFGTYGRESSVTSRFLADHPTFSDYFHYDGHVVPVVIEAEWAEKLGLPRPDYFLHELLGNTAELPYAAVSSAITYLILFPDSPKGSNAAAIWRPSPACRSRIWFAGSHPTSRSPWLAST